MHRTSTTKQLSWVFYGPWKTHDANFHGHFINFLYFHGKSMSISWQFCPVVCVVMVGTMLWQPLVQVLFQLYHLSSQCRLRTQTHSQCGHQPASTPWSLVLLVSLACIASRLTCLWMQPLPHPHWHLYVGCIFPSLLYSGVPGAARVELSAKWRYRWISKNLFLDILLATGA